jgi:hypothetical protein
VQVKLGESGTPTVLMGVNHPITSLSATKTHVLAGTADGMVLAWNRQDSSGDPDVLYGPTRRPVESINVLDSGGVARLFIADNSPGIHARVLRDTFSCQYLAGGQILRRAAAAPDLLVGTNEPRDRLICWKLHEPDRPAAIIPIARLTGHSIQDVCLIPMEAAV